MEMDSVHASMERELLLPFFRIYNNDSKKNKQK